MMVSIINVYRVLLASYVIIIFIIITKCLRTYVKGHIGNDGLRIDGLYAWTLHAGNLDA